MLAIHRQSMGELTMGEITIIQFKTKMWLSRI